MNEEPLFEQRRKRAIQVGRLGKLPEFIDQPRRRLGGTKEIREDAETIRDLAPDAKGARLRLDQFVARILYTHSSGMTHMPRRGRAARTIRTLKRSSRAVEISAASTTQVAKAALIDRLRVCLEASDEDAELLGVGRVVAFGQSGHAQGKRQVPKCREAAYRCQILTDGRRHRRLLKESGRFG